MPNTTNFNWTTPADTDLVKDGALAIRTLANGIDTSLVDLKGGTTGQVLAKATNTDLDFSWVAQDDSDAIQNAIIDAKGDLIVGTAADTPARLAIGNTNGMLLTVDSAEASGMKWAAAPSAGSNWSLLNTGGTALTGAQTITVSGISGADKIMIIFDASASSAGSEFSVRFNSDSGNNYYRYGTYQQWGSTYINGNYTKNSGVDNRFYLCSMGGNSGDTIGAYCFVTGCNSSGLKVFQGVGGANGTNSVHTQQGGYYDSSSTISSISVVSSNSNFDAGTVYVYTSA